MPFMVIYRTSDGASRFEQAGAIDEAALFVERLRNKEGIDQIRIYRMEEIGFAFRPYYKVELGASDRDRPTSGSEVANIANGDPHPPDVLEVPLAATDPPANGQAPAAAAPPPPPPVNAVAETVAEPVAANGRPGLFGR